MTPSEAVQAIRGKGIAVVPGFVTGDELSALRRECENLLEARSPWIRKHPKEEGLVVSMNPFRIPDEDRDKNVSSLACLFASSFVVDTTRKYLGWNWRTTHLIVDSRQGVGGPLGKWHLDFDPKGMITLKIYVYLTDAGKENGGFDYIEGSHRLTKRLGNWIGDMAEAKKRLHDFDDFRKTASEYLNSPQGRGEDDKGWSNLLQQIDLHIQGEYESDDAFAIEGRAGTMLIFDSHGVHRGGHQNQSGKRLIVRGHQVGNWPSGRLLSRGTLSNIRRKLFAPREAAYFW